MSKKCSCCGEAKDISNFFTRDSGRLTSHCKSCLSKTQVKKWRDRKREAVNLLGEKCILCGYNANLAAFHFHHLDPKTKECSWGVMRHKAWHLIIEELKKCVLLCANCHAEIHAPPENQLLEPDGTATPSLANKHFELQPTGKCPGCGEDVYATTYCSRECAAIGQRKVEDRPNKQELEELIATKSLCAIGRQFGVSDNAIRKWAKRYGIPYKKR